MLMNPPMISRRTGHKKSANNEDLTTSDCSSEFSQNQEYRTFDNLTDSVVNIEVNLHRNKEPNKT